MTQTFGWTGEAVSVLGQGTWTIEQDPEPQAIASLHLGIELGMTLIDTAEMYGNGRAEEVVGKAIRGRRDQLFVVSKVLPSNASYDGTRRSCEMSLRRLGIDHLDLYLLHWPSTHPIGETMRALESLVRERMTRFIGVSNFDVDALEVAQRALTNERLAANQVLYHLHERGIERRLIPHCQEQGIAVMGYTPFGRRAFPSSQTEEGRTLAEIANRHDRTPRQVVLNFLTRGSVFSIPKSGHPDHVRENAGAVGWKLTPEDVAEIDRQFPAPEHDVPLAVI